MRNLPNVRPSRFKIHVVPGLENSGIQVHMDDVLRNGVTKASQLMNGVVPWRGPREKDPGFMQILIESFSLPGDMVFDYSAATGLFQFLSNLYFVSIVCSSYLIRNS